jgi:hypothetical protein
MPSTILTESLFRTLLSVFAFAPLLLLFSLFFVRDASRRSFAASLIFFLPALLITGLWVATNGQTNLRLGDTGLGLMIYSAIWVVLACLASLLFGAFCVRSNRWVLLWMVPEVLLFLGLGVFLVRAFA